jgi:hypothetical protein
LWFTGQGHGQSVNDDSQEAADWIPARPDLNASFLKPAMAAGLLA